MFPWQEASANFCCLWIQLKHRKKRFLRVYVTACQRKIHRPNKTDYEPGQGCPSRSLIFSCFLANSRNLQRIFQWQEDSANFWCLWFSQERTKKKFSRVCVSACQRKIHRPTKSYDYEPGQGCPSRSLIFSCFLANSRNLQHIFPWQEASAKFCCLWFSLERKKKKNKQICTGVRLCQSTQNTSPH